MENHIIFKIIGCFLMILAGLAIRRFFYRKEDRKPIDYFWVAVFSGILYYLIITFNNQW